MTKPGKCLIRGTLGLVGLLFCGPVVASESNSADGRPPVRSLLEIRREGVTIQSWDLSCGAAALAILLRYEFGEPVTEKEIARGLMRRSEYVAHPELLEIREGFSLLDLKRYVNGYGVQAAVSNSPGQKRSGRPKANRLAQATSAKASQTIDAFRSQFPRRCNVASNALFLRRLEGRIGRGPSSRRFRLSIPVLPTQ